MITQRIQTYKKGSYRFGNFLNVLLLFNILALLIPTLALSKSGYRSKVTPSSQPVIQAPAYLIVFFIIPSLSKYCNRF